MSNTQNNAIIKTLLLNGETLENLENENVFLIWFSPKTQRFCLQKNSKMICAVKTFKTFDQYITDLQFNTF